LPAGAINHRSRQWVVAGGPGAMAALSGLLTRYRFGLRLGIKDKVVSGHSFLICPEVGFVGMFFFLLDHFFLVGF
jgi:hypothetical protein